MKCTLRLLAIFSLNLFSCILNVNGNECDILSMCKCTNFPLFTLIDTSYLSKPRSTLNQDLFCTYVNDDKTNKINTFEQLKYFYYRFRTLTFANYPLIPTKAFRYVHFESQSVKHASKINNRNVLALINIKQTEQGIFEELTLTNAHDQLLIYILNSPELSYVNGALSHVNCYELKLLNTNPKISIDFFSEISFIHHLIIDNPTFSGFIQREKNFKFQSITQIYKLSIKHINVRHLQSKHFSVIFKSVEELTLENYNINGAFRSLNSFQIAQTFPNLKFLKIYSCSIQTLRSRMFKDFIQLEYLILNGIQTIENEAFYNLYHLKQLNLGENIHHIDPYAFLSMNTKILLLNQSLNFQLNDERDFCKFVQFSPTKSLQTFVQLPIHINECSCTIRYLYRHVDKSFMSLTPTCYSNASLYILTQEERICYFEQRLLQCDILPDHGITIYGIHYNVSYFYQQQIKRHKNRLTFLLKYRYYYILILFLLFLCLYIFIRKKIQSNSDSTTHRNVNRIFKRRRLSRNETFHIIYYHNSRIIDSIQSS